MHGSIATAQPAQFSTRSHTHSLLSTDNGLQCTLGMLHCTLKLQGCHYKSYVLAYLCTTHMFLYFGYVTGCVHCAWPKAHLMCLQWYDDTLGMQVHTVKLTATHSITCATTHMKKHVYSILAKIYKRKKERK